MSMTVTVQCFT